VKNHLILPLDKCKSCPLYDPSHYNPYNATGNFDKPKLAFIGEAPGGEEERTGKVFQGRSGQRLRKELRTIGIDDDQDCVFFNVCCCRPPGNTTPGNIEIKTCKSNFDTILNYLISLNSLKCIIPLGNVASKVLIGKTKITNIRGHIYTHKDYKIPILPTYHPAYILRNPAEETVWLSDLKEIKRIMDGTPIAANETVYDYRLIKTIEEFDEIFQILKKKEKLAIDIETTGLNYRTDQIIGISFSWEKKQGIYIPLLINKDIDEDLFKERDLEKYKVKIERVIKKKKDYTIGEFFMYKFWGEHQEDIIGSLREIVSDPNKKVAGANYKFDSKFMEYHWDCKIENLTMDVVMLDYLLDENRLHSIKNQADRRYEDKRGYSHKIKQHLSEKEDEEGQLYKAPIALLKEYGCSDVDVTFRLAGDLWEEINKKPKLLDLYIDLYLPMHNIYKEAEQKGISVDLKQTKKVIKQYEKDAEELAQEIYKQVGYEFNIGSGKQLGEALFDKMGIPHKGKTKTNQYKTDKETLNLLATKYPICADAVRYKNKLKMISTYLNPVLTFVDDDGRIHYNMKLTGAVSGRLASPSVREGGVPVHTIPREKEIRHQYIADSGNYFLEHDYSQIELRIIAWYSQDPVMLKAYKDNEDLHIKMACEVFRIKPEMVTVRQRKIAKCLPRGQLIPILEKGLIPIEEIKPGDHLGLWDNPEIYLIKQKEKKKIINIVLKNGIELKLSENHKLPTTPFTRKRDYKIIEKKVSDLKIGDRLFVPIEGYDTSITKMKLPKPKDIGYKKLTYPKYLTGDLSSLLGWIISEGQIKITPNPYGVTIGQRVDDSSKDFDDIVLLLEKFGEVKIGRVKNKSYPTHVYKKASIFSKQFTIWIAEILDFKLKSNEKDIPKIIMRSSYNNKIKFIRSLFKGDGSIHTTKRKTSNKTISIVYSSSSENLCKGLQQLLLSVGVFSNLRKVKETKWKLIISLSSINKMLKIMNINKEFQPVRDWNVNNIFDLNSKIERIKKLEVKEEEEVWDLIVNNEFHHFIANGILIHNSTNFGTTYLGGATELTKSINEKLDPEDEKVDEELVQHCINTFWNTYKGVAKWVKMVKAFVHKNGYVVSPLGRIRRLPNIYADPLTKDGNKLIKEAEREAVNSLVQGLGSDLLQLANIRINKRIKEKNFKSRFLFSVHDAIYHNAVKEELEELMAIIKEEMEKEIVPGLYTPVEGIVSNRWKGEPQLIS